MSKFATALESLKKIAEGVKTQIHTLDKEIGDLNTEREALIGAPVSREDFLEYLEADVLRRGSGFVLRMKNYVSRKPRPNTSYGGPLLDLSFTALERHIKGGTLQPNPYMDADNFAMGFSLSADAFYWYFGELIVERYITAMDAVMEWPAPGEPLAERRARLAEIDAQIEEKIAKRDELAADLMSVSIDG